MSEAISTPGILTNSGLVAGKNLNKGGVSTCDENAMRFINQVSSPKYQVKKSLVLSFRNSPFLRGDAGRQRGVFLGECKFAILVLPQTPKGA
ncbi:hypothetical protein BZG01_19810 [Labilibaculum manganireducens]|uniref:Uncharacterized protein n=1 Tax=Labilibaculum manganireducens TaxID=1940525 RepID=A0A2N3HSW3_9BACT|nr:hypothetical protein [Labilibaculum manganireducens]PKQ61148.1 hypothetical protein BZG01_19810 [Labilibaculum manganireducens]